MTSEINKRPGSQNETERGIIYMSAQDSSRKEEAGGRRRKEGQEEGFAANRSENANLHGNLFQREEFSIEVSNLT